MSENNPDKILGGTGARWRGLEDIFHILRIMPTSHAARKENWEVGWVWERGGGVSGSDQRPGTIKPETRDLQRVSVGKC